MSGDDNDESDDRSVDAFKLSCLFVLYKLSTIDFQFTIERLKSMHAYKIQSSPFFDMFDHYSD